MPRYEQLEEAKLTSEQRRIWDECKAGPRGSVPAPVHVWLRSPGLADHAHKLGAYVRFGTPYTPKPEETRRAPVVGDPRQDRPPARTVLSRHEHVWLDR
jgi:hypothetical protein